MAVLFQAAVIGIGLRGRFLTRPLHRQESSVTMRMLGFGLVVNVHPSLHQDRVRIPLGPSERLWRNYPLVCRRGFTEPWELVRQSPDTPGHSAVTYYIVHYISMPWRAEEDADLLELLRPMIANAPNKEGSSSSSSSSPRISDKPEIHGWFGSSGKYLRLRSHTIKKDSAAEKSTKKWLWLKVKTSKLGAGKHSMKDTHYQRIPECRSSSQHPCSVLEVVLGSLLLAKVDVIDDD
ncbi:hypothetical protein CRG98_016810 [Punica granatum]|uniref:Uncharacterized protein n=1 Tax=Punica granatum TaxID=22663 RepID=A0A2I0K2N2_PUNGR|nr:hypothetical protein CRG98_016810 [Punica granatum]